jgi:hypothetical protein
MLSIPADSRSLENKAVLSKGGLQMGFTSVHLPLGGCASSLCEDVREPRLRFGTIKLLTQGFALKDHSGYAQERKTQASRDIAYRRRLVGLLTLLFTVAVSSFGIAPILKGKISALDTVGLGIFVFIMLGGSFNFWLYAIGFVLDHRSERRKKGIQTAEYPDQGNPKSEYRNPKQVQNGKKEETGKRKALPVWLLCFFHFFRIVSDFGFRISKLLHIRVHPCASVVSAPVSSVSCAQRPSPLIPLPSDARGEVRTRTAIVMPIYNEDMKRVGPTIDNLAGLLAGIVRA